MYWGFGFQEMSQAIAWAECLNSVWTESEVWFKSNLAKNCPQPHCVFFIPKSILFGGGEGRKEGAMSSKQARGCDGWPANLCLSELNFTPNFVLKHRALSFFYPVRNEKNIIVIVFPLNSPSCYNVFHGRAAKDLKAKTYSVTSTALPTSTTKCLGFSSLWKCSQNYTQSSLNS